MRENTVSIPGISVDTGLAFHPGNLGFELKTIALSTRTFFIQLWQNKNLKKLCAKPWKKGLENFYAIVVSTNKRSQAGGI